MSRYHSVRPKKHKHKQHAAAPQPAAQAPAAGETFARERLHATAEEIYGYRGGEFLDASIARWRKMLEVYDREQQAVFAREPEGGYRWTVSPAMAFRADIHLAALVEKREKLKIECYAEAREYLARPEDDSLCLAKEPAPATGADSRPLQPAAPVDTAKGGQADAGPIGA